MIIGIGVDTVDIERFGRQLTRTPALLERLFAPAERELPMHSLAARFAAREALIKALGGSHGLGWHDMEVVRGDDRVPAFAATPGLNREMAARGADRAHLSMTHEAGVATAFVVIEAAIGGSLAGGSGAARSIAGGSAAEPSAEGERS
ncbi:MAG: holo-ACP synthase [Candidatus Leucobacter sulfamidivorax]|nr:holo-ACP synthase [Candidatus Leucobacter sulfamidivorax]